MTTRTVSSLSADLKSKIESRQARVAVIGMGYVGLPLALLYTDQKFRVTGFDIDQKKVDTLNDGVASVYAAAGCACAHCYAPLRVRHLVVQQPRAQRHLEGQRPRDDHQVRLARRRARGRAEALDIGARTARMHQLDRAAREPE